jgi:hypothetical protein
LTDKLKAGLSGMPTTASCSIFKVRFRVLKGKRPQRSEKREKYDSTEEEYRPVPRALQSTEVITLFVNRKRHHRNHNGVEDRAADFKIADSGNSGRGIHSVFFLHRGRLFTERMAGML